MGDVQTLLLKAPGLLQIQNQPPGAAPTPDARLLGFPGSLCPWLCPEIPTTGGNIGQP